MVGIALGIEKFLSEGLYRSLENLRVAVLSNQSAVTSRLTYSVVELSKRLRIAYVLAPEHGFWGEYGAGEEFSGAFDEVLGLEVRSIYGPKRVDSYEVLKEVDAVLVDIQDLGVRFYTYVTALLETMEYAARYGVSKVVVLDRPNPLGCYRTEGPLLEKSYRSYVGYYTTPLRFGLTLAELALLYNNEEGLGLDLSAIPMSGYTRSIDVLDVELPWVPPSPAIPDRETVFVYPSTALLEGTNVSEGRGTYTPFKVFGAPFVNPVKLFEKLSSTKISGVYFRPTYFKPIASEFAGERCGGVFVHVVHRRELKVVELGMRILESLYEIYSDELKFVEVGGRYYTDLLIGTPRGREAVVKGEVDDFLEQAEAEAEEFKEVAKQVMLYT